MASNLKNLSSYNPDEVPDASKIKFGIIVSEWNWEITGSLLQGVLDTLHKHKASDENLRIKHVPGSFELPLGAQYFAEFTNVDVIICLGCVIQGETRHFDYICQGVTQGIMDVSLKYKKPVIFGVLTTNDQQQAKDRSGGKHGNKGDEAAITAIKMVALRKEME